MVVRCITVNVYRAPGSQITPQEFQLHREWVDYVYAVPGTFWGNRSPNPCSFIIRWRFQDDQGTPIMAPIDDLVVPQGRAIPCVGRNFNQLPTAVQDYLRQRPTGPGPYGGWTNDRDIAVFYIEGPISNAVGCTYVTPDGTAILIENGATMNILAHELGHALGLVHVNDDIANIMSPRLNNSRINPRLPASERLTPDQCTTISQSDLFQDCPD